jgi:hypothetical protein
MEGNARTWFTPKQKAELWERWKSGQCVADIARALIPKLIRMYRVWRGLDLGQHGNCRDKSTDFTQISHALE